MAFRLHLRTLGWMTAAAVACFGQAPVNLTPDPMVIEPGHYSFTTFEGGRVAGKFRITNPMNDVQCMVLDEENFINFQGNHKHKGYYFSGKVAAGSFSLTLATGNKYYLIFSNTHSVLASATVVVKAEVLHVPAR